ncbi:V/A-type H+-transporting ATPase subunit I [Methanolinea mesophila]|nr:V/A-type H+-transporting ATPase subunit I [Methanolinea mesophila]
MEAMYEAGMMEVIPLKDPTSPLQGSLEPGIRPELLDRCAEYQVRLNQVLDTFEEIPASMVRALGLFFTPPDANPFPVRVESIEDCFRQIDTLLTETEGTLRDKSALITIREKVQSLERRESDVNLLLPFQLDLALLGDFTTFSVSAVMVKKEETGMFLQQVTAAGAEEIFIDKKTAKDGEVVLIAYPAHLRPSIHPSFRLSGVSVLHCEECEGTPDKALATIRDRIRELREHERERINSLEMFRDTYERKLLAIREELRIRKEELDLIPKSGSSRDVTYLSGWIPAREVNSFTAAMDRSTCGHFFSTRPEKVESPQEAPVMYDNPRWLRPFEFLTTMFARPKYGEIDPTPFMAPIFVIFFGLMLGDAGYGILLTLSGFLLYWRFRRSSSVFHDLSIILTWCGISAVIFGTLQGGWFGDVPSRFFGISPPLVLLEPIKDPIAMFQIALLLGILHINLGLTLGFYQNIRKKEYNPALMDQGVWFIIQPSAAILMAVFFGWITAGTNVLYVAVAGIVAGLAIIFYSRGPMGFFALTGFLGDWLSYVRILALALATGGIAMTVNILAELVAEVSPYLVVLAVLVFLGGQLFNLIIQSLGGMIHSIRLQYIEFFSKFFIGGGEAFTPFRMERMYSVRGDA